MDDLLTIQEDNLGGLLTILIAPVYFFSADQVFKSGYSWIPVDCTSETMQFNESTQLDADNGSYIQTTITGELPKIRPDVSAILLKYRQSRFIVQCQDLNGNLRLAGTLAQPLSLTDVSDTGKAAGDANIYTFSFAGNMNVPALFL